MNRHIDAGPGLVALGALLLFVSLFLNWFGDVDGWQLFESLDLILVALAITATLGAAGWMGERSLAGPIAAAAAFVAVAVQLIQPPAIVDGADARAGAWLALASAALMTAGAVLSLSSISVTIDLSGRDPRRRVAAVDRRAEDEEPEAAQTPAAPASRPATAARTLLDDGDEPGQRTQPFGALGAEEVDPVEEGEAESR